MIQALQCKHCLNIIYSRHRHDFRKCDCGAVAVDGGFDYFKVNGNFEDFNYLKINKNKLLEFILFSDWNFGNINAEKFKEGYHGKFVITEKSNKSFFNELIDGEVIYKEI